MVKLTEYEQNMLEGAEGPAVADFTDVDLFSLIRTGDIMERDGSTGEVVIWKKNR